MEISYISVCSGIEAATVAWEYLGWKAKAFAEIEKFPSLVLAHHYPNVPNVGDFTKIQGDEYGSIDLLVGGTPCQDFSVAGLRAGLDGQRGQLTIEFARLAERLRPTWLVWENVPGVLSIEQGRAFGTFLAALGKFGYGFAYRILDAQYFGVPQRRRRVFVVGYLGDWRPAAAVLFEREGLFRNPAPSRKARQETTSSIGENSFRERSGTWWNGKDTAPSLTARSIHQNMPDKDNFNAVLAPTVTSKWAKGSGGPAGSETGNLVLSMRESGQGFWVEDDKTGPLRAEGENRPSRPSTVVSFVQNTRDEVRIFGGDGQSVGELAAQPGMKQQPYLAIGLDLELNAVIDGSGPLKAISPTGGGVPAMVSQKTAVRRLTPRECERLQGFPDDYTKINEKTADGPRYKALGNSMAVPVMRWIGQRIELVETMIQEKHDWLTELEESVG